MQRGGGGGIDLGWVGAVVEGGRGWELKVVSTVEFRSSYCLLCACFQVPRPHLSFEAQLVAGKSHDFGPISCPDHSDPPTALSGIAFGRQKHEAESKYPQRIRRLNIFPSSKYEVLY
ncbi:unnamed protein product [Fraxinus pennsylvanica]|uniref:Uncharacterized protein n=1 Tax=Fraxinus pennsylvanica TaxID=56036 RepID=A0AAD1YV04_9LAMI|nr:unnamed protein product [Fraxinus pennsylvanica]